LHDQQVARGTYLGAMVLATRDLLCVAEERVMALEAEPICRLTAPRVLDLERHFGSPNTSEAFFKMLESGEYQALSCASWYLHPPIPKILGGDVVKRKHHLFYIHKKRLGGQPR